jgi:proteasome lid subunit RPN8/RPN11
MALSCVYLAADVYMVCLQHALSTEKEEVMGLLIGEVRIVKFTTDKSFFLVLWLVPSQLWRYYISASFQAIHYCICKPLGKGRGFRIVFIRRLWVGNYAYFWYFLYVFQIDSKKVAHVSAVVMLRRSDKRKDRVEISPEQLTNAAIQADKLTHELGQPMRVLGWYHSHPHITVWPSHVGKNLFLRKLLLCIFMRSQEQNKPS